MRSRTAMLLFLLAGAVALSDLSADESARRDLVEAVVAVVGDKPILWSELNEAMAYQATLLEAKEKGGLPTEEADRRFAALQVQVRDNLVDNMLILLAAEEEGVSVDDEVQRAMERLRSQFKDDAASRDLFLSRSGFASVEDYERQVREELLRHRMVMMRVKPRSEVTEAEARAEFSKLYGNRSIDGEACAGAVIRKQSLEQLVFSIPKDATLAVLVDAYAQAYKCFLALPREKPELVSSLPICIVGAVPVEHQESGEVDETTSFQGLFQQAFLEVVRPGGQPYSEPFVFNDSIRILALVGSREECVTDADEQARLLYETKARMEEEKFDRVLAWWLSGLRGKYRVELKPLPKVHE